MTRRIPAAILRLAVVPGIIACLHTAAAATTDTALMQRDLATIFQTSAPQPLLTHSGSELDRRIQPVIIRQAGYLTSLMKPWAGNPGAQSITASGSDEHSIRPNARTVDGLAMMVRSLPDDAFPTTLTRDMCRRDAISILRYLLYTHGAGGVRGTDGKQWKSQWQSALWANSAGTGCWLLWDDLDPEMRWLAARMITDEADRFIDQTPPAQVENDTKAEENAWDSTVITLAACMFPRHPHHDNWVATAQRWALSSFVRKADLATLQAVAGDAFSAAGIGPTLHDDYTMENHDRVHPDYMNTINICLDQWIPWSWAGQPLPAAYKFNTSEVFHTLKALTFPDAGYIYVNGQDWQLHRNAQWLPTYIVQAVFSQDAGAAMLARRAIETAERMMARTPDGGMFLPEEFSFPSTQGDTLEMYANVHLLLSAFGDGVAPMDEQAYWDKVAGAYIYDAGNFAIARTGHSFSSFSSFSWGDRPMGLVMPLSKDMLLSPNERSLIGTISVDGVQREQPKTVKATPRKAGGDFIITGEMLRTGDAMSQHFAFVTLADGRSLYVDNLRVLKPVRNPKINLGTIAVLNDPHWVYHDGTRDLYLADGKRTFNVADGKPSQQVKMASAWYNLDDQMGVVAATSSGSQTYDDNKKIGNGRLEQIFCLNAQTSATASLDPSDTPVAKSALVFYPGQRHEKTDDAARHVKAVWSSADSCSITLEDGTSVTVQLATGEVDQRYATPDTIKSPLSTIKGAK